jgi:HK97 family phage major capsid protein
MDLLDSLNVMTVPPERIPEVIDQLAQEGHALVARCGERLTGADAERFARIEQCIGTLNYRARADQYHRTMAENPRMAKAIEDGTHGDGRSPLDPRSEPGVAEPGRVAPIRFSEHQMRTLYDAVVKREARDVCMSLPGMERRDITTTTGAMSSMISYIVPPDEVAREPTRIASYMPAKPVTTANVTFYQQTEAADAAAVVAEGAASPMSDPVWTARHAGARKISHWVTVTTEALADYEGFTGLIDRELIAGLINKENDQLLNGTGVGFDMTGLLATNGITTYAPVSAEPRYKSLRHAKQLLRSASGFIAPDIVVLNPVDYELFDLSNAAAQGLHAVPNLTETSENAWSMPIVQSTQIASGTAMVANLASAATFYVREPPTIYVDPYTLMTSGLVRILAEERVVIGVERPSAVCRITFNGPA